MLDRSQLKTLLPEIEQIVQEVGFYALEKQRQAKISVDKGEGDYATDIDIECERRIIEALGLLEHSFPVYTEEENIKPDDGIYWVVDPIDGTKNYFKGLPLWTVNVALYDSENDEILLGVVFFPKLGEIFTAHKDGGAKVNGYEIKPSSIKNMSDAFIYAELPNSGSSEETIHEFNKLLKTVRRVRGWGLAAAMCYTANGAFDGHYDFSGTTKPFDVYAALIIAEEAGCRISGFKNGRVEGVLKVLSPSLES